MNLEHAQKHVEFVKKIMRNRDILYYITEQDRIATLYWAVNTLSMLGDPLFEEMREKSLIFVFSCLKKNGGFSPTPKYEPNIISTFQALQILFIYDFPYYNKDTVDFICSLQNEDGAFCFDLYGDIDTRFDCCGVLSIHLLSIMKEHCKPNELIDIISLFTTDNIKKDDSQKNDFNINETDNLTQSNFLEEFLNFNIIESTDKIAQYRNPLNRNLLSLPISKEFLSTINFDLNLFLNHILSCFNYDGGCGQIKGSESHAAQIFCALSSLRSLDSIDRIDRRNTIDFLVYRQTKSGGLSGRVNKKEDVCYSFWTLSSMIMLESEFIDIEKLREFIFSCEDENGGFSDRPGNSPDLYHLMFSLASLSLLGDKNLKEIEPGFAI